MQSLMIHKADVYRPTIVQSTAQQIDEYNLVYADVPCFIQPASVAESFYYEQRGAEGSATIYSTDTDNTFLRNDIFEAEGQQFHVVGVKNNLFISLYVELTVVWYSENAKKRLSRESYGS